MQFPGFTIQYCVTEMERQTAQTLCVVMEMHFVLTPTFICDWYFYFRFLYS